jgi:hypothetical protein
MDASNAVQQLVNILQALKNSISPQITQFKEYPISILTDEKYIIQELSMFRKIVYEEIKPMDIKGINTLQGIMSIGLDYETAMKVKNLHTNTDISKLYESMYKVIGEPLNGDKKKFENSQLQCEINKLIYQKKLVNITLSQKIQTLKMELEVLNNEDPRSQEKIDGKNNNIKLFEEYKGINNTSGMIIPEEELPMFKELPNNGFLIEDTNGNSKQSFWRCIQDWLKIKGTPDEGILLDKLKTEIKEIPIKDPKYSDSKYADALKALIDDNSNDDTIDLYDPNIKELLNIFVGDHVCIKIFHRNYDIFYNFNRPALIIVKDLTKKIEQENLLIMVADGNHYQLVTYYKYNDGDGGDDGGDVYDGDGSYYQLKDKTSENVINGVSILYPLYYDKDGILTERNNLTEQRKSEIILNESRYDNNYKFSDLTPAKQLHILHRFDIDLSNDINIDKFKDKTSTTSASTSG